MKNEFRPAAKINLGLRILERLPNGYHRLETLMFPLEAPADNLVITAHDEDACHLQMTGRPIDGNMADNLVVRAWKALKEVYPAVAGVNIVLAKRIPAGAGLGGGSADAAATLAGLNAFFDLGASTEALAAIGAKLGSDIPFFLYQKPMLATGTGTELEPFELDLSGYRIVLLSPPIHSSTVGAYQALDPKDFNPQANLAEVLRLPVSEWKDNLINDLEKPIFQKYPKLSRLKAELYAQGAVYAAMSGSGSSVFGLFERK